MQALQLDAPGMHSYDRALVNMLQRGKVLDSQEIIGALDIDPETARHLNGSLTSLRNLKCSA